MIVKKLTLSLMVIFLLASCATDRAKKAASEVEGTADGIELNADSDSGKAGPLKTIFFEFNSARLTDAARLELDGNADFLKMVSVVEIQIEGHCDERGGVQYNLALGEKRAKAIKDYLVTVGIESNRISTISFGKERPLSFGHDEESWGQNRRGNFVITAK